MSFFFYSAPIKFVKWVGYEKSFQIHLDIDLDRVGSEDFASKPDPIPLSSFRQVEPAPASG